MKIRIIIFILLTLGILVSCKKQEKDPDTVYETLYVNAPYLEYGLKENTVLNLDATTPGALQYQWTPGNSTDPVIQVIEEGIYSVTISTSDGNLLYNVLVYYEGSDFFVPNSFTPNNDGINDLWGPVFFNVSSENYSIKIYDESNKLLFSTTDLAAKWDGNHNGNAMDCGYYYYVISYKTLSNESKSKNGMLQLIR